MTIMHPVSLGEIAKTGRRKFSHPLTNGAKKLLSAVHAQVVVEVPLGEDPIWIVDEKRVKERILTVTCVNGRLFDHRGAEIEKQSFSSSEGGTIHFEAGIEYRIPITQEMAIVR
jgi:hypothetical protein